MLINNIDSSTYGVTSCNKEIGIAEIITYDDWLRNSDNPANLGQKSTYKPIDVSFFLRAQTEQAMTENISNLSAALRRCTLKFDGLDFTYSCTIIATAVKKYSKLQQQLDVQLKSAYAYKPSVTETMDDVASKTINIAGNSPSPAIVTITAPVDTISITLAGLGDPITINNLKANIPVVIDGEACTVMSGGANKFGDTDMWEFPTLQPGVNSIGVSTANCVINISYKPKFI